MNIRDIARRSVGNNTYIVALIIVAVATHVMWFVPGSILFHTDWLHWTDKAASQAWYTLGTWSNFFGFGQPRIQIGFTVFQDLWALFVNLGASFDTAVKFTLMVPIALLGFLSPYFAVRRLTGDVLIAFVAALFYGSTTYFLLKQGSHLPIALVYALAPLILSLLVRAYTSMRTSDWVLFAVVYSVGLWSEVRIMYILTFVLALYVLIFFPDRAKFKQMPRVLLVVVPLVIALNALWLIPTAEGSATTVIAQTTARALFGNFLFDLPHSLTLSGASWTGGVPDESFIMQPIPIYLWLVPLVIVLPFALGVKLKPTQRRFALLFGIIAMLGIFLTKQAVAPLPGAYPWLYAHFPGFSLFREASKLYLLTALGYMGLLALGLLAIRRRRFFWPVAGVPVVIAAVNLWPLLSGGFDTLFVARHQLPGYDQVNKTIMATSDMTRSLWLPLDSQWAYFDTTHPKIGAASIIQQEWAPFVKDAEPMVHNQLARLFTQGLAHDLVQASAAKYIIVPARDIANEDDFYRYYGDDRQFYIDILDKTPWLKHVHTDTPNIDVYEIDQAKPYIDTASSLISLTSLDNLETQRNFVQTNNLASTFNFALNDQGQVQHGTQVRDIFDGLMAGNIQSGKVTATVTMPDGTPALYVNGNKPVVSYSVSTTTIGLSAAYHGAIRVNGQAPIGARHQDVTSTTKINPKNQYFVAVGDQATPVDLAQVGDKTIGTVSDPVRVVATDGANLVPNPSFEQGPWQPRLRDCNNYDDNARIGMEVNDSQHSDGDHSLRLNAANHTACTDSAAVPVTAGGEYLLQFDFRGDGADQVNYQLSFNDSADTTLKKSGNVNDKSWHTIQQLVAVPKGATALTIRLLVMPHMLRRYDNATIYFDNVRLGPLATVIDPKLDLAPQFQTVAMQAGKNDIEYDDSAYSGQNLVPNPSLESGLWQKTVGDCDAYDHDPQLTMSLATSASDGGHSLELQARRHMACTGPGSIPIKEGATYLLSFDHQSPNTKSTQYHVSFDDPNNSQTVTEDIPVSDKWETTTRIIRAPVGARNIQLSVYANAPADGGQYTKVRYDNFKLIEIPDVQARYYAVSTPSATLSVPRQTTFTNVLPTKKLVHIKGATGPFFLTMSEDYDPQWRLEVNNGKVNGLLASWWPLARPDSVAASDHIKWDDFTNGWYVDVAALCQQQGHCTQNADGSYNIELMIEFTPERWFDLGALITILSFIGSLVYLLWRWLRSRRPPKPALPFAAVHPARMFKTPAPRPAPPLRVPPRDSPPKQPPRSKPPTTLIQL